ncbi:MAG: FKBP-type peptidyl-prolyl cis-trans isomerase [Ferruginibacter sp.]
MKHFIYLLAVSSLLLVSCNQPFKKGENGMLYKIISDNKGSKLENGNFFELQLSQVYTGVGKDSVMIDPAEFPHQIVTMDSVGIPPAYYKIFTQSRKGDSIIVKQLTDSLIKAGNAAPFMKKGASIVTSYKIVNIFTSKEGADSAYKHQMEMAKAKDSIKAIGLLVKDDATIAAYLAKNNIKAVKAPLGTYVEIITPGSGPLIDTSVSVKVLYTGKTMEGVKFDSNVDTTGGRPSTPLLVTMSGDPSRGLTVIKGWNDGLTLLNKGAKAKFYIPSSLAYGSQAQGEIKANEILIFDIDVVDLLSASQAVTENEKARKDMMAQREAMMKAQQQAQGQQPTQGQ